MSTELDPINPHALADVPQQPASPAAVQTLMQHAQAMSAAKQLADALCTSDLVPAVYKDKPGNGAAAILYGAELGLNPIQSLQQVFVVYGSPAIYARTMVALVKARGYRIQTVESSDESVTVAGWAPDGMHEESTWTFARAKRAGYTSNRKYDTDPQAMLYAKAAAEVCRKLAPDVLLGISHSVEELRLDPIRAESVRVDAPARASAAAILDAPPTEPEAPAATTAQNRKMHALFRDIAVTERDERLTITSHILGEPLTTSGGLTRDTASKVIDTLEQWVQDGKADDMVREILNAATLADAESDHPTSDGAQA